jgi:hypothetical protein
MFFSGGSDMKRVTTGFCVAATLGCIATLGAQTSTTPTTTEQRAPMTDKAKDVSVTGCLAKAADGKFTLTNAKVDSPMTGASSTTTGSTSTTTAGTTTTTGTTAANAAAMSWALTGGTDLDKHVGHKIQVTGRSSFDSAMDHSRMPDPSAAAGTTAGTTAAGPTAGATGTSGTTTTAAAEEMRKDTNANQPRLDVQSVKMIAPSCS